MSQMALYIGRLWPDNHWGKARTVAVSLLACALAKKLFNRMFRSSDDRFRASRFTKESNKLVLHQFSRGKFCPNLSPFALKLESFLRLSNIPYTVESKVPFGPKTKCPWVNLEDGRPVGDSQFIIKTITEQEQVKDKSVQRLPPGDDKLSARDEGALEGMRVLAEEQLFWCVIYYRYHLDKCQVFLTTQNFPPFLAFTFRTFMPGAMKKKGSWQGIAKHTPDEVYQIAKDTCRAFDAYLGDSPYLCGDEPGTADCAVFGQLAQIMWNAPNTRYQAIVMENFPRLGRYCNRMKDRIFPDWDTLLQKAWEG